MVIKLSDRVFNNEALKKLLYYNSFIVGNLLREGAQGEVLDMVMISMVGMGGFAYDENRDESRGRD